MLLLLALTSACASTQGWQVSGERTCVARQAPRVCVQAQPDHGHVLALGDAEFLPGECVAASAEGRGGLVRVTTRDRVDEQRRRWVGVRRGRVTLLWVAEDGRVASEQRRCEGLPIELAE